MAARHLEIAREDGPKAGFKAWIEQMERSGLPQVKERLAEVQAQGNKKAQFEYYCNVYGKQIFGNSAQAAQNAPVQATEDTPNTEQLFGLFREFMNRVSGNTAEIDEDDSLDDDEADAIIAAAQGGSRGGTQAQTRTSRSSNRRSSNRTTRSANTQGAPDSDPFRPRNPQDVATAGRLWRLNEAGCLKIVKAGNNPITNGEAHEILKDILA